LIEIKSGGRDLLWRNEIVTGNEAIPMYSAVNLIPSA